MSNEKKAILILEGTEKVTLGGEEYEVVEKPDLLAEGVPDPKTPVKEVPPKQIIVMRTDLKMRKGKMIAQGAHASMAVVLNQGIWTDGHTGSELVLVNLTDEMRAWICGISDAAGIPSALIIDKGLTEFKGIPTKTCCALGPALPEHLDPITGHLKLL
jgi:PTH2 family peptidyl-tRNA hydrolase